MVSTTFSARYLLVLVFVVAGIGTLDAALDEHWDLLVVFAVLDLLLGALVVRTSGRRQDVPVRSDLVAWLRRRAAMTGEDVEAVVDRAVASYRDRMDPRAGQRRDGGVGRR